MKYSIDVTIYPPGRWNNSWTIETKRDGRELETYTDCEPVRKLVSKMFGIENEIREQSIVIHGWIPGPKKR